MESFDDKVGLNSPTIRQESPSKRKLAVVAGIVILLLIIVVVIAVVTSKGGDSNASSNDPIKALEFENAAVAADSKDCSQVGSDILQKKGNAIDAAIATLFCTGLIHMHSTGIGGGGFLNFYKRSEKKAYIYDFREVAPGAANESMFLNASSVAGGLAIAVPGNIKGLHHIWKKHGSLKWPDLIQPTINYADNGFVIPKALAQKIVPAKLEKYAGMKALFKKSDGTWYKEGDTLTNKLLASTLKKIQNNPDDFYTGDLAKEIVQDIKDAGGIVSEKDLTDYSIEEREPLVADINDMKFYFMPPPGSGAVIAMTMNILKGFNLSSKDVADEKSLLLTTHKIIEALKFAFARRPFLADPKFEKNVTEAVEAMTDATFAETLRQKIMLNGTYYNESFYGGFYLEHPDPQGTTHVSILAENGDAVATTDTINFGLGSLIRSTRNGIIYNNEMDDFAVAGKPNLFGYEPAYPNFIRPGKRPLSSMSPTIVTDKNGDVIMVAGASGGSRIITATAQTLIRRLLLGEELGKAVTDPRIHTHLLPYEVYITEPFPLAMKLQDGLKKLGHTLLFSNYWSAVQAIYREKKGEDIYAKSDPRKGGVPSGY